MDSAEPTAYLTGAGHLAFTARVGARLLRRLVRERGILRTPPDLVRYLMRESSLSASTPMRLVRHRGHTWAVPDLPPLDGEAFLDCLAREVAIARNQPASPVTAIVSVTGRCPHHCPYCYVARSTEAGEPTVGLLCDTISELARCGVKTFHLSGGEPALRTNDIVDLLRRLPGPHFWMLTTGSGLEPSHFSSLAAAGLAGVMVSLDSLDRGQVNRLKGDSDAFDTAIRAMRGARRAGLLVAVNAVMSRPLLGERAFSELIATLSGFGASFVNCYAPRIQSEPLPPDMAPFSIDEYRKLHRLAHKNNMSRKPLPLTYTPDVWEAVRGCQGGRGFLYIDPAGEVRRCPFLRKGYGNIRGGDIAGVIRRMQADPAAEVCEGNRMLSEAVRSGFRR